MPADAWERLEVAAGSKGPRIYDRARARLPYETAAGAAPWVLLRRSVRDPEEVADYRGFGPDDAPLEDLARVAGTRWVIAESFEQGKGEVGLDHYEGRRWDGWYRHITLCLLAHAYLEVTRAQANGTTAATLADDHKGVPAP